MAIPQRNAGEDDDQLGRNQRLDDGESSTLERTDLEDESEDHGHNAGEPHRSTDQIAHEAQAQAQLPWRWCGGPALRQRGQRSKATCHERQDDHLQRHALSTS